MASLRFLILLALVSVLLLSSVTDVEGKKKKKKAKSTGSSSTCTLCSGKSFDADAAQALIVSGGGDAMSLLDSSSTFYDYSVNEITVLKEGLPSGVCFDCATADEIAAGCADKGAKSNVDKAKKYPKIAPNTFAEMC